MQGYITQIFYIRTEDDEDFRLKLMIKGEVQFKSFQPRFWAILKSFSFGKFVILIKILTNSYKKSQILFHIPD